jgi:hypothetical protein
MKNFEIRLPLHWLLFAGLLLAGCSNKEKIVLVPVEGKLMMDGKPVPLARVEFMPEFKGHGADANSYAITDENGKFVLARGAEAGVAIAMHRVVVTEAPPPDGTRGQDDASQAKMEAYTKALKNRPLHARYQNYSTTPLRVEITAEKHDLVIEMQR